MTRQAIILFSLAVLIVILSGLDTGDAKFALKGCLVGYERKGKLNCVFVGCPKGYRTLVRYTGYGQYKFCIKQKRKPSHRYGGYVSANLIFAYVRQRIRPCKKLLWLRRELHLVWKRVKSRQGKVKATRAKIRRSRNKPEKLALEVGLKRLQELLNIDRKALSLLLRQVIILERRRRLGLSLSYRKLRWWISRGERRLKQLGKKLAKRKTKRTERTLKRWRLFVRKLRIYLMKVISIIRRRRFRGRLGYVWNRVRRVKMALKQIRAKLHKVKGGAEQKRLIRKENLLWTDLIKWKRLLDKALQSQNALRRRRIQKAVHNLKRRIDWIHKRITHIEKVLKKAIAEKPKDERRKKWMKYILAKWNRYLVFIKRRYHHYVQEYKKLTKKTKPKDKKSKNVKAKMTSKKPRVVSSSQATKTATHKSNDGHQQELHRSIISKTKSVSIFRLGCWSWLVVLVSCVFAWIIFLALGRHCYFRRGKKFVNHPQSNVPSSEKETANYTLPL